MTTKHTPGYDDAVMPPLGLVPWTVKVESDPDDNGEPVVRVVMDGGPCHGDEHVALVYGHGEGAGPTDARMIRARLIAAAPYLLAALEKIHANAAESVEWIRNVTTLAISRAKGGAS